MSLAMIRNERGVAILVALILAIVVTLTASIVLSLSYGRLHQSAFQSERAEADMASEGGIQYANARIPRDNALQTKIRDAKVVSGTSYIISPTAPPTATSESDLSLRMGGTATAPRDVTLTITYLSGVPGAGDFRAEVRASSSYVE